MELSENRDTDQWNRIDNTGLTSYNFSYLLVDRHKKLYLGKKCIFNSSQNMDFNMQNMKLDPNISPCTKLNIRHNKLPLAEK